MLGVQGQGGCIGGFVLVLGRVTFTQGLQCISFCACGALRVLEAEAYLE